MNTAANTEVNMDIKDNNEVLYKEPAELFKELKKELEFLPNEEAKDWIINSFIYTLHM